MKEGKATLIGIRPAISQVPNSRQMESKRQIKVSDTANFVLDDGCLATAMDTAV
jgi:hypothetical protein